MKRFVAVLAVILGILTSTGCVKFEKEYDGRYYNGENEVDTGKKAETVLKIGAVKGSGAVGLVKLTEGSVSEYGKQQNTYDVKFFNTDKELLKAFENGEIDIASLPINRASRLYNEDRNSVVCVAANTLCTLSLLENGNRLKSVKDMKDRTLYLCDMGGMSAAVVEIFLEETDLDEEDLHIVYKDSERECIEALSEKENALALVSEPYVTEAKKMNPNIRASVNLSSASREFMADAIVMSVLAANRELLQNNPDAVNLFLDDFRYSCKYAGEKPDEIAALSRELGAIDGDFDKETLSKCGNRCIVGEEMKAKVQSCLDIIYTYEDDLIGGELPDEDFYFLGIY